MCKRRPKTEQVSSETASLGQQAEWFRASVPSLQRRSVPDWQTSKPVMKQAALGSKPALHCRHRVPIAHIPYGKGRPGERCRCYAIGQASAQVASSSNGSSAAADAALPEEVMKLFAKTQRNLMEVNRSRLDALQELGAAHARIAELEKQLREAKGDAPASTSVQSCNASPPATSTPGQGAGTSMGQVQAPPGITLAYQTGWPRAFLHFCADRHGWTKIPGKEMQPGTGELSASRVITVKAQRLEFVINNGSRDWDTPDPYGLSEQKNYVIEGHGTYRLKSGKVHKLR